MKIAVEGCCHGQLDAIYDHIESLELQNNYLVDLLLICGDFQAIRNHEDLQCMAVPDKYRHLGDFYKYYTGEKVAPVLTIIIGGNHEASNYFWELYHGGWVAPNIYFLGHAGCVRVDGIRIAGASGIYKPQSFRRGSWEMLPYDNGSIRSIYHIREYNIRRLSLLSSPDIFLSHDWPQSIEQHGAVRDLLRRKPFFRADIDSGRLGSPPLMGLLKTLKPKWWFAAHLHVRFEATVVHNSDNPLGQPGTDGTSRSDASLTPLSRPPVPQKRNPDEIAIDMDDFEEAADSGVVANEESLTTTISASGKNSGAQSGDTPDFAVDPEKVSARGSGGSTRSETKFLALDKCLPRRAFLEVMEIPCPNSAMDPDEQESSKAASARRYPILTFDTEWLGITRAFHSYLSISREQPAFPSEGQAIAMVKKEIDWVMRNVMKAEGTKRVDECQTFVPTAPGAEQENPGKAKFQQPPWYTNPQTESFCAMLELENKINPALGEVKPHG